MNHSKNKIIDSIRTGLHRGPLSPSEQSILIQEMANPSRGIIPQSVNTDKGHLIDLFIQEARLAAATVESLTSIKEVPSAILRFLKENHLNNSVRAAKDLTSIIAFEKYPDLKIDFGNDAGESLVHLTAAFCGISETGTLTLVSSPDSPTLLNFLGKIHIVLLASHRIVPAYEDAWDFILENDLTPRMINFITGPSRTGDIEQRILLGVHGPKQLHIILYNEE